MKRVVRFLRFSVQVYTEPVFSGIGTDDSR